MHVWAVTQWHHPMTIPNAVPGSAAHSLGMMSFPADKSREDPDVEIAHAAEQVIWHSRRPVYCNIAFIWTANCICVACLSLCLNGANFVQPAIRTGKLTDSTDATKTYTSTAFTSTNWRANDFPILWVQPCWASSNHRRREMQESSYKSPWNIAVFIDARQRNKLCRGVHSIATIMQKYMILLDWTNEWVQTNPCATASP